MAHIDAGNAAVSGVIGTASGIFWNITVPQIVDAFGDWALHTVGAVATAIVVAYCVYKFNIWIKKREL